MHSSLVAVRAANAGAAIASAITTITNATVRSKSMRFTIFSPPLLYPKTISQSPSVLEPVPVAGCATGSNSPLCAHSWSRLPNPSLGAL